MTSPVARDAIPLVVAVTGHIDLRPEDHETLKAQARAAFADLQRRAPNTPILLLSGLAEGSDRLVAEVALELKIGLVATLPMPRHLYEDDFKTDASRAEFASLLGQARRCIEVPLRPTVTDDDVRTDQDARERQYEALAAFLVTESHLVLALWNGVMNGATGGTSEVVRFARDGVPADLAPVRDLLTEPQVQPVLQIVAARTSTSTTTPVDRPTIWLFPTTWGSPSEGEKRLARQLGRLDTLNRDADRLAAKLAARRTATEEDALTAAEAASLPPDVMRARSMFAVVDALAVHYRDRALLAQRLLVGLLFLAAASLAAYYYTPPRLFGVPLPMTRETELQTLLVLAIANAVALFLAIGVYELARRGEYFVKHQDYRALAEALRVNLFWLVAGIDAPVAEQYLQKHRSELDWIRDALRAWRLVAADAADAPGLSDNERLNLVLLRWVQEQADYFDGAADRLARLRQRQQAFLGPLIWVAFGMSLAWVAVLIVTSWRQLIYDLEISERRDFGAIALVAGLASVIVVLLRDLTHTTSISALVTQYRIMASLFERARQQVTAALASGDETQARLMLVRVGREALRESGDWLLMHRERQLKNPSGR